MLPLTPVSKQASRWVLAAIVLIYMAFGGLYAVFTPRWQAPDEPAHFNYIRYVAEQGRFPVLQIGDYPAQYLEEIKAARFPATMSIDSIRYESHQPPLHYVLGALVYRGVAPLGPDAQFFALRLLSVILGAGVLLAIHALAGLVFPDNRLMPLVATAFVAVIPMHIAMTAAINNDTLAELLLLLVLYVSVRVLRLGVSVRRSAALGVLATLILLTKTTVYTAGVVILVLALFMQRRPSETQGEEKTCTRHLAALTLPPLLLATPWFVRNAIVYGGLDVLAWQRHDLVAGEQLGTRALISQIGPARFMAQFARTTFTSFWGQFGWMGVLIDERLYQALAVFSFVLLAGIVLATIRLGRRSSRLAWYQRRALALLVVSACLTGITYLWYNLKYVQHQGRYLFPALGPLAIIAALGMTYLLEWRQAKKAVLLLAAVGLLLIAFGLSVGDIPAWALVFVIGSGALLTSARWLSGRWYWVPLAPLYIGFLWLDWVCLFEHLVPALL